MRLFDELLNKYPTKYVHAQGSYSDLVSTEFTSFKVQEDRKFQYGINLLCSRFDKSSYSLRITLEVSHDIICTATYHVASTDFSVITTLYNELDSKKSDKNQFFSLLEDKIKTKLILQIIKESDPRQDTQESNEKMDLDWKANANRVFNSRENLEYDIREKIFPALTTIETAQGITGMGFFQISNWLVSNAHVIKHKCDLQEGVLVADTLFQGITLEAEEAYHRPWNNPESPDVVVIKVKSRLSGNQTSLPREFSESSSLSQSISTSSILYFYVDTDFTIKYLKPLNLDINKLPMTFESEDNSIPQSGCSGTPIIAALVLEEREPKWTFKTIGALYARCTSTVGDPNSTKLVCAIPIMQEFSQILTDIILPKDSSEWHQKMAEANSQVGNEEQARAHQSDSVEFSALAKLGFKRFENGDTVLNINLPDGLEKLAGSTIVTLEYSYLPETRGIPKEMVPQSFNDFLNFLQKIPKLDKLSGVARTKLIEDDYWRIDCESVTDSKSKEKYWRLQLQDKTGKGETLPGGKSKSSVFAEVKIPKTIEYLNGFALAEALKLSQQNVRQQKNMQEQLKSKKGAEKTRFEQEIDTIPITIIVGKTPGHPVDKYKAKEQEGPKPLTPRTINLFNKLSASFTYADLKSAIDKLPKDEIDRRINAQNDQGNTPLMILLEDKNNSMNQSQIAKARLLIKYGAIRDMPNKAGKTANQMLEEYPEGTFLTV